MLLYQVLDQPYPAMNYQIPKGVHAIPSHILDLRPDVEVDHDLLHPKTITDEKNIWYAKRMFSSNITL